MFRTDLSVSHVDNNRWRLHAPLVYEGASQYFVIKAGFDTDFASIPKPVRWLLDSAGRNAEAAVLHDAVWRESQRPDDPRVDPWHADGLFRRALRETGATALTRGLMWFAVRAAATVSGRFGHEGPNPVVKILQLLGVLALGIVTALGPTLVAIIGLAVYLLANWLVALIWQVFERRQLHTTPNWPWPADQKDKVMAAPPPTELLLILDKPPGPSGSLAPLDALLERTPNPTNADVDALMSTPGP